MYCPKCGTENPDGAQLCQACSWVLTSTSTVAPRPDAKTSGLAIAALVLAILSPFACFFTALPAIILGIIALVKISKSSGQLKGNGLAITGIVLPVVLLPFIALMMALLMPGLARVRQISHRMVCGANMAGLGKAMLIYTNDNDGVYPSLSKWCDLLIEYTEVTEKQFVCPSASCKRNEVHCHYAMNPNCGPNSPRDIVLLFETKGGWNQYGGPEILTTDNHQGEGCNVLFTDLRVAFISTEDIKDLNWGPGVTAYAPVTRHESSGISRIKRGTMVWLKCRNADCKAEYQMDKKEYFEYLREHQHAIAKTMAVPAMVCKNCKAESVYRAEKCERCGVVFERGAVPHDFSDRCTECGYSKEEERRKRARQGR